MSEWETTTCKKTQRHLNSNIEAQCTLPRTFMCEMTTNNIMILNTMNQYICSTKHSDVNCETDWDGSSQAGTHGLKRHIHIGPTNGKIRSKGRLRCRNYQSIHFLGAAKQTHLALGDNPIEKRTTWRMILFFSSPVILRGFGGSRSLPCRIIPSAFFHHHQGLIKCRRCQC